MIKNVTDSTLNLKKKHQIAFRRFMIGKARGGAIKKYLGTDLYIVREWISKRFVDGMSWNNYGDIWQIDHIVPLRMFNLNDHNELKIAWHYKNLIPLFKTDNLNKEGNIFFAYILLSKIKRNDYYYCKLFEKVNEEIEIMYKYIHTYTKQLEYK